MQNAPADTLEVLLRDLLRRLRHAPLLLAMTLTACGAAPRPPAPPPVASAPPVAASVPTTVEPAAPPCTSDVTCGDDTPRCDTALGACVACLAASDCAAAGQACVGQRCVACTADAQCASGRCQDGGSCAPLSVVVYVDHDHPCRNDVHASSASDPYCEVAPALPAAGQVVVQLAPSPTPYAAVLVDGHEARDVSIMGPGAGQASLAAGSSAAAIDVAAEYGELVTVFVHGVTLIGTTSGYGLRCTTASDQGRVTLDEVEATQGGEGGVASTYCALVVTSSSMHDNALAGISATGGVVTLSHDYLFGNLVGGLVLMGTTGTFEHLTAVSNGGNGAGGVFCDGPNLIADSIVVDNSSASLSGTDAQIDPRCLLSNTATGIGATRGLPCSPDFVSGEDPALDWSSPETIAANQCALGLGADPDPPTPQDLTSSAR